MTKYREYTQRYRARLQKQAGRLAEDLNRAFKEDQKNTDPLRVYAKLAKEGGPEFRDAWGNEARSVAGSLGLYRDKPFGAQRRPRPETEHIRRPSGQSAYSPKKERGFCPYTDRCQDRAQSRSTEWVGGDCWNSTGQIRSSRGPREGGGSCSQSGLHVKALLDTRTYEKWQKVSSYQIQELHLRGHSFHPDLNYTLSPRTKAT